MPTSALTRQDAGDRAGLLVLGSRCWRCAPPRRPDAGAAGGRAAAVRWEMTPSAGGRPRSTRWALAGQDSTADTTRPRQPLASLAWPQQRAAREWHKTRPRRCCRVCCSRASPEPRTNKSVLRCPCLLQPLRVHWLPARPPLSRHPVIAEPPHLQREAAASFCNFNSLAPPRLPQDPFPRRPARLPEPRPPKPRAIFVHSLRSSSRLSPQPIIVAGLN